MENYETQKQNQKTRSLEDKEKGAVGGTTDSHPIR
jgi:hypothetical protein